MRGKQIYFTEKELILVRQAVNGYVEMMGEGENTFEIIEEELENGLSKAIDKIGKAYAKLKK